MTSLSFWLPNPQNRAALGWVTFLLCCGPLCWSCVAQVTVTVGPNVNITRRLENNSEECIAINPLNPANLFAADTWAGAYRYSMDGADTWQDCNVSALDTADGDVAAAFDSFGNLFLAQFGNFAGAVQLGLSTNGGASFSLLYQTSATDNDQPKVTTGPSGVAGQGSVWITYTLNYSSSSNRLAAQGAAVSGLGSVGTFGSPEITSVNGDYGDLVIGSDGQLLVSFQNPNTTIGPDTIRVDLDADGLGPGGFGTRINVTSTQVGSFLPIPAQPHRDIDSEPKMAWDRSGGPHNGRVYLSYADRPSTSSDDTDLFVRYSDDNGSTWSNPVRVNDDPVGNGKSQFLSHLALDQTTGNIAVSFYDCRNSLSNNTAEVWAAVSIDGGQSFLPNVKISAGVSSALVAAIRARTNQFDFGDYSGLCYHAGTFYPCWADNSNSTGDNPWGAGSNFNLYTARVTVMPPLLMLNPRRTNATFHVSVQTVAMKTYSLDSTSSLNSAAWTQIASVPGDGTIKELVDTNGTATRVFYRLRAQ